MATRTECIVLPYRLGEGEVINYLIEKNMVMCSINSELTKLKIISYGYSDGERTLFHSCTRCHGLSLTPGHLFAWIPFT